MIHTDFMESQRGIRLFDEEIHKLLSPQLILETESVQKLPLILSDVKDPLTQMNLIRSTTINQEEQDFCRRHFGMQVQQLIIIPIPSEFQM